MVNLTAEPHGKREMAVKWAPPERGADDYLLRLQYLEKDHHMSDITEEATGTEHVFKDLIPGSLYNIHVTPRANRIRGPTSITQEYTSMHQRDRV